jgi:hypothetical protein
MPLTAKLLDRDFRNWRISEVQVWRANVPSSEKFGRTREPAEIPLLTPFRTSASRIGMAEEGAIQLPIRPPRVKSRRKRPRLQAAGGLTRRPPFHGPVSERRSGYDRGTRTTGRGPE